MNDYMMKFYSHNSNSIIYKIKKIRPFLSDNNNLPYFIVDGLYYSNHCDATKDENILIYPLSYWKRNEKIVFLDDERDNEHKLFILFNNEPTEVKRIFRCLTKYTEELK